MQRLLNIPSLFLVLSSAGLGGTPRAPDIAETRVYQIRQTVALNDVPADAKERLFQRKPLPRPFSCGSATWHGRCSLVCI